MVSENLPRQPLTNPYVGATQRLRIPFENVEGKLGMDRNEDLLGWPPAAFRDFIAQLSPKTFLQYPSTFEIRKLISQNHHLDQNCIWITAGCDDALSLIFRTYLTPHDQVLSVYPTYGMYPVLSSLQGAMYEEVHDEDDSHSRTDRLLQKIQLIHPRLVVVANPNQPSGFEFSKSDLVRLTQGLKAHGGLLVVDEAYFGFGCPSAVDLVDEFDNLLVTRTFSKAYGLAGMRIGYIASNHLRISEVSIPAPLCETNGVAILAAQYILNNFEYFSEHILQIIRTQGDLADSLRQLGFRVLTPHTNFVVFSHSDPRQNLRIMELLLKEKIVLRGPVEIPDWGTGLRATVPPTSQLPRFRKALAGIQHELTT